MTDEKIVVNVAIYTNENFNGITILVGEEMEERIKDNEHFFRDLGGLLDTKWREEND